MKFAFLNRLSIYLTSELRQQKFCRGSFLVRWSLGGGGCEKNRFKLTAPSLVNNLAGKCYNLKPIRIDILIHSFEPMSTVGARSGVLL